MPTLPIPIFVALVLGFLVLRSWLAGDRPWLFRVLVLCCAVQGVLVSLVQHFGMAELRPLQPVTATLLPPLAWIAFRATAIGGAWRWHGLPHAAAPAVTALCVAVAPAAVDAAVPLVFLGYGVLILRSLRAGDLPLVRIAAGEVPGRVWRAIAVALILSAASDGLITLALAAGETWLRPWIVSVVSSLWLLCIGALGLSSGLGDGVAAAQPSAVADSAEEEPADRDLLDRLDRLVAGERLYLDPDLTLARLARRLRVPVKRLSVAVNRTTGENVSRFINGFRVRHAGERLDAGDPVTTAMLESGFNTKSNFNREFLRVTGMTPSAWAARARRGHGAAPAPDDPTPPVEQVDRT